MSFDEKSGNKKIDLGFGVPTVRNIGLEGGALDVTA
jgi:hypothetical protein